MTHDPQALTAAAEAEARYDGYDDLLSFSKTTRERYIDRAGAAVAAYLAAGWQDISTAPKDGTHVLLFGEQSRDDCGVRFKGEFQSTGYWDIFDDSWCATGSHWDGPFMQPTHWMPLGPPPVGSGQNLADANSKSPIQAREE